MSEITIGVPEINGFFEAIGLGQLDQIDEMLSVFPELVNLYSVYLDCWPLQHAIVRGYPSVVTYLLEQGALPSPETPKHMLANFELLKVLGDVDFLQSTMKTLFGGSFCLVDDKIIWKYDAPNDLVTAVKMYVGSGWNDPHPPVDTSVMISMPGHREMVFEEGKYILHGQTLEHHSFDKVHIYAVPSDAKIVERIEFEDLSEPCECVILQSTSGWYVLTIQYCEGYSATLVRLPKNAFVDKVEQLHGSYEGYPLILKGNQGYWAYEENATWHYIKSLSSFDRDGTMVITLQNI